MEIAHARRVVAPTELDHETRVAIWGDEKGIRALFAGPGWLPHVLAGPSFRCDRRGAKKRK